MSSVHGQETEKLRLLAENSLNHGEDNDEGDEEYDDDVDSDDDGKLKICEDEKAERGSLEEVRGEGGSYDGCQNEKADELSSDGAGPVQGQSQNDVVLRASSVEWRQNGKNMVSLSSVIKMSGKSQFFFFLNHNCLTFIYGTYR